MTERPRRTALGDTAAIMQNAVKELEASNHHLEEKVGELENTLQASRAEGDFLRNELSKIADECDFYKLYSAELRTELKAMGETVVDRLKRVMEKAEHVAYTPRLIPSNTGGLKAIAEELETEIPEFLKKGPAIAATEESCG